MDPAQRTENSVQLQARNREIVAALYKACVRGNWAAAAEMLSADVLITEAGTLPFGGTYRGVEAMRGLFAKVMQSAGIIGVEGREVTSGGDWVVVLQDLILEGAPPVRAPFVEAFRLHEGKVCEIVPYYFDPGLINAAAARRAQAL